jgi:hypothetical protein
MAKLKRGMVVVWWYYSTQMIEGMVRPRCNRERRKQPLDGQPFEPFPDALIPGTNMADLLNQ